MPLSINEEAQINILSSLADGRLIQGAWSREADGKRLGCLLYAAGGYESVNDCQTHLMPRWVAECTITMFDKLATDDVPVVTKRYAAAIGKWGALTSEAWDNIIRRWLVRLIDQAVDGVPISAKSENYWPAIEKACADVKAAIASGDKDAAARAAADAAEYADYAADYAAARAAADAAEYAAYAADYAAARAAADAAEYAADYAAADAARAAARAAASKSLFNALLDEIEKEIAIAETP